MGLGRLGLGLGLLGLGLLGLGPIGCSDDVGDDASIFEVPPGTTSGGGDASASMGPETSLTGGTQGMDSGSADEIGTLDGPAESSTGPSGSESSSDGSTGSTTDDGTTDGSTTDGTGDPSTSSESGGGVCMPVPPGMGACPPECTGGCGGGTCTITCGVAQCSGGGQGVTCPDGWPCFIDCTADNSCSNATHQCGDSGCEILCSGINACLNSTLVCGPQECVATCMGPAGSLANFDCAACSCVNNGC